MVERAVEVRDEIPGHHGDTITVFLSSQVNSKLLAVSSLRVAAIDRLDGRFANFFDQLEILLAPFVVVLSKWFSTTKSRQYEC
jgi:hypothetical protein